jgi:hypothetical protein
MGECSYSATILNVGTSGQLPAPAALLKERAPSTHWNRRLVGPQSWSGRCGEKKNLASARILTLAVEAIARCYTD